jgi:hypothetical protein
VDENVQPANSLMGVKPKSAKSGGADPMPGGLGEADDGAPTLNLQNASGAAVTGAPRSL